MGWDHQNASLHSNRPVRRDLVGFNGISCRCSFDTPIYSDMRCSRNKDNDQIAARLAEVAIDSLSGQPPTRFTGDLITDEELLIRH